MLKQGLGALYSYPNGTLNFSFTFGNCVTYCQQVYEGTLGNSNGLLQDGGWVDVLFQICKYFLRIRSLKRELQIQILLVAVEFFDKTVCKDLDLES
jgi:hypothetical protein